MSIISESEMKTNIKKKSKKQRFLDLSTEIHKERTKLLHSKGQSYSGNTDPFKNFKQNAERLGLSKYQIWQVYAFKHIDSISNAIKSNPSSPVDKSEGLKGRIHDAQNYLDLLYGMLVEDNLIEE